MNLIPLFITDILTLTMGWWLLLIAVMLVLFFSARFIYIQSINYQRLNILSERQLSNNSSHIHENNELNGKIEEIDPLEEARIFARYGKFDQAIKILQWQIKAFPKETVPYSELFIIYIHLEDKTAYYNLLTSAPFSHDSAEFQGFLANALLNFPEEEKFKKIAGNNQSENSSSSLENHSKGKTSTQLKTKQEATAQEKEKQNQQQQGHQNYPINEKNKQNHLLVYLKTDKKIIIDSLIPLEKSIFMAFNFQSNTPQPKLSKQLLAQKKKQIRIQQKVSNTVMRKKNSPYQLIRIQKIKDNSCSNKTKDHSDILVKFYALISSKKEKRAISLLENTIKANPLQEKLYPILIQSYINLGMINEYHSFRESIFSHEVQPAIEIILFINDSEDEILKNLSQLKLVA